MSTPNFSGGSVHCARFIHDPHRTYTLVKGGPPGSCSRASACWVMDEATGGSAPFSLGITYLTPVGAN